jgi:hypothetical protein
MLAGDATIGAQNATIGAHHANIGERANSNL